MAAWFSAAELKQAFPHLNKLISTSDNWLNNEVIPWAQKVVLNGAGATESDDLLVGIAKRFAKNVAMGEDENIVIARARGQSTFTVAGDTVTLDLSRNPYFDAADLELLKELKEKSNAFIHTDKLVVASQGRLYDNAPGGRHDRGGDYVREEGVPGYFAGQ